MRVRAEVRLAAVPVGDVRVALGRSDIGVAEHLLDAPEVGAPFEQVGRERVAEEMRMHAARLEARAVGQAAEDQERSRPGQCAATCVEEEIGAMPTVEPSPRNSWTELVATPISRCENSL